MTHVDEFLIKSDMYLYCGHCKVHFTYHSRMAASTPLCAPDIRPRDICLHLTREECPADHSQRPQAACCGTCLFCWCSSCNRRHHSCLPNPGRTPTAEKASSQAAGCLLSGCASHRTRECAERTFQSQVCSHNVHTSSQLKLSVTIAELNRPAS